ncbi:ABC transporter permease [Planosporangium thailandense]|uniref:ABC transporter permease n=1 Tax=Planosporangium thailandense TaxID=765197 RepID=A0ABX0Y6P1_9ACTN|nr:ABC transporter permease [Planosporangium thailandense]NJC74076.1 ABC transporter permease [Planosporangium thailandense]
MDALRDALPRTRGWFTAIGVLIAVFLLAPLIAVLPLAFTSSKYLVFPAVGFSWQWFDTVLTDPAWQGSIMNSARVAVTAAVIAMVTGTSAALAVRRISGGRRIVRTVLLAPMVMPQLVLALGLYLTYKNLVGGTSLTVLTLGQATLAMPLVFVTVSAGLAAVDPNLSRAAQSLGYRWPSVVWRIELPLVGRSVISGAILAFAVCFDEAVLAFFLVPPSQQTLPVKIWTSASENASPAIAAASALVICLAVTLLAVVALVGSRPNKQEAS